MTLFGHTELVARADSDVYSRRVDLIGHDLANFANIQGRFGFSADHHEGCLGARGRFDFIGIWANQNYNLWLFSSWRRIGLWNACFQGIMVASGGQFLLNPKVVTRSQVHARQRGLICQNLGLWWRGSSLHFLVIHKISSGGAANIVMGRR